MLRKYTPEAQEAQVLTHLTVLSMLTDARRSAVVGSHLTIAMELV